MRRFLVVVALGTLVVGCDGGDRDGATTIGESGITATGPDTDGSGSDSAASQGSSDGEEKLDVGGGTGAVDCQEGDVCDDCTPLEHTPCDNATSDPYQAMGINCPGEPEILAVSRGAPGAMGVRTGFGPSGTWNAREGSAFAVIGSGLISDLDLVTPTGDSDVMPTNCNDDVGAQFNVGNLLPDPLRTNNVAGDCTADTSLLGTGDCSNTVEGQFSQGMAAFNYTEMRLFATVPPSNNSISYDFAFFSTEYPYYYGDVYNDMYVGWLESESWTGNISFDESGNPISLNAGFLDFRDDGGNQVPEFDGTCMKQHAGTKWLSTTAPVTPGEEITVVFAIFDMADPILDSYVFLDNFSWGCDGTGLPTTKPVG
jgi:hypothetical protein